MSQNPNQTPGAGATSVGLPALMGWGRTVLPAGASITITLGDPKNPIRTLTHDTRGQVLDGAQWQAEQGPVHSAFATAALTTSTDLAGDRRWPYLQLALATEAPVSALAIPICQGTEVVGVLGAYSDAPDAFTGDDVRARASLAASGAALVIAAHDRAQRTETETAQLHEAMVNRAVVEQAKGIVAVHLGIGVEDAFAVISWVSQNHNLKLARLAAVLVDAPSDPKMAAMLRLTAERYGRLPSNEPPDPGGSSST